MFLEYKDLPLCQFSQIFLNLNNCLVLSHQSAALFPYEIRTLLFFLWGGGGFPANQFKIYVCPHPQHDNLAHYVHVPLVSKWRNTEFITECALWQDNPYFQRDNDEQNTNMNTEGEKRGKSIFFNPESLVCD